MLIISGRAYKRKHILFCTFVALFYAALLPFLHSQTFLMAAHIPEIHWFDAVTSYMMRGTIVLIACRTLYDGLTLHRPLVVADETGLRVQSGSWVRGVRFVRWDEIRRADVSTIQGPEVLWNRSSRWQWRTLTFYAADSTSLANLGWRNKIARYVSGGAVACISEAMAGPQFGELIAFANAHIQKHA